MRRKNYNPLALLIALLFPAFVMAQTVVSGRVTDAGTNTPLEGATITVRGTKNSTLTDTSGKFSINVPTANAKLVVTYVGYSSRTLDANNSSTISLSADNSNLSEVVVTGLATSIKRSNSANSVATISAKELAGNTRP